MSNPFGSDRPLSGAHRSSTNPRLHALQKPYARPSSYSGPSSNALPLTLTGNGSSVTSPTKAPAPSTRRPQLPSSASASSLPRSGSDSSLFSGIKSILSRPLQWLATPSKSHTKRDSLSSFGHDVEEQDESPTGRREGKRPRRLSPRSGDNERSQAGPYDPKSQIEHIHIQGRAVSGFMLPPLPPHISLTARSQLPNEKPLPNRTNFSRPLNNSTSMPYLDPPTSSFAASPARRRIPSGQHGATGTSTNGSLGGLGGMTRSGMSRSSRMDLSTFGDDDNEMAGSQSRAGQNGNARGKEVDAWSPWKGREAVIPASPSRKSSTPLRRGGSMRMSETRDVSTART
jgi:nucleoporin NUP1